MGWLLIAIRRIAIVVILLLAYRLLPHDRRRRGAGLDRPDLLRRGGPVRAGLLRRADLGRATARGAMAGITAGFAVWAYTLLLPSFADAGWIGRA